MKKLINRVLDNATNENPNKIEIEQARNLIFSSEKKIAFFAGAGFSKMYMDKYPLGMDLFSIHNLNSLVNNFNFFTIAKDLGIKEPEDKGDGSYADECYNFFSQIKYHLDIYKRYPSLMPSFLDNTGIFFLENEIRKFIKDRFVDLVGENELEVNHVYENKLLTFFEKVIEHKNFSFITTNYDYVIEKNLYKIKSEIKINRGVTSKKCFDKVNTGRASISLFKINGGFDIHKDCCGRYFVDYENKDVPNIILPSEEQNYDDKYFKTVFMKSTEKLREADLLVFVGYSLPSEDKAIQFLLKNFSDTNSKSKQIIFIGRSFDRAKEKLEKISNLFPLILDQGGVSFLNGSFDDFLN